MLSASMLLLAIAVSLPRVGLGWYVPPKNVSWQYQLSDNGSIDYIPDVDLYIVDIDTAREFIPYIRDKTRREDVAVVCYFSAGSFETFREKFDLDRGPHSFTRSEWGQSSVGNSMDGWPGEYWVDIRSRHVKSVMKKRMAFAKSIGCSGVDPDNVDGYSHRNTGFTLKKKDQIAFNTYMARTAHSLGLGIGLKNAVELLEDISSRFDWFINESCFVFRECAEYSMISDKAVLIVEYCDAKKELGEPTQNPGCYCAISLQEGWNTLIKQADLGVRRLSCEIFCQKNKKVCQQYESKKPEKTTCRSKTPNSVCRAALGR